MTAQLRFLILAAILPATIFASEYDATLEAGASGTAVVKATLEKLYQPCLFEQDYMYLRRLAHALTADGTSSDTYKTGGGIWKVSNADFTSSKTSILAPNVNAKFGIKWADVKYEQLKIPMYSAIAAGLVAWSKSLHKFPVSESDQAALYKKTYSRDDFIQKIKGLSTRCAVEKLDIVFVMDESGSVGQTDYNKAKEFTANVVSNFNVGPDAVRVGLISFSSSSRVRFDLTTYTTKAAVVGAVRNIPYNSGGTNTSGALDTAKEMFTNNKRAGVAKVAIVMTDAGSNNPTATLKAAQDLKQFGVELFSIGIGSFVIGDELKKIASAPGCRHTWTAKSFSQLGPLIADIKEMSCSAPAVISEGSNIMYSTLFEKTFRLQLGDDNSFVIRPTFGKIIFYVSFGLNPANEAMNDFSGVAYYWKPVVVYTQKGQNAGGYITCTVMADTTQTQTQTQNNAIQYTFDVYRRNSLNLQTYNMCIRNGKLVACSYQDIWIGTYGTGVSPPASTIQCPGAKAGVYAHPSSPSQYVVCLESHLVYVLTCPSGLQYDANTQLCSKSILTTITVNLNNCVVCTSSNWMYGLRRFALVDKASSYLKCSSVNKCTIQACNNGKVWKESARACRAVPSTPAPITKPKSPSDYCGKGPGKNHYHFDYPPDNTKFIHCNEWGQGWLKSCPAGLVWRQRYCGY